MQFLQLKKAQEIAAYVYESVGRKFCEIMMPVGSIRREEKEIKDIDFVLVPRCVESEVVDLFGGKEKTKTVSQNFVDAIKSISRISKGAPDGRYLQIILTKKYKDVKIDLFIPEQNDFFRILTIRTGSARYIQNQVGPAWKRLGWVGTDYGLRRMVDCKLIDTASGKRWELERHDGEKPPVWESERHFFEWLEIPLIQPHLRKF